MIGTCHGCGSKARVLQPFKYVAEGFWYQILLCITCTYKERQHETSFIRRFQKWRVLRPIPQEEFTGFFESWEPPINTERGVKTA